MTTQEPDIRLASVSDAEAIAALTDAAYQKYVELLGRKPQPMTTDYVQFLAEHPIWLLDAGGELAGLLALQHEAEALLIYSVAIHPAYQKHGYGRRLLAWAEQQAKAANYREIRLYTNALMQANIALYTWLGYRETRREAFANGTAVHMSKELS